MLQIIVLSIIAGGIRIENDFFLILKNMNYKKGAEKGAEKEQKKEQN